MAGVGRGAVLNGLGEDAACVREERQKDGEALFDGAGVPGQVHYERAGADHGYATREHGERRFFEAFHPECDGNAGHIAFGNVARCLRGNVPGGEAGTTSGNDDLGNCCVAPVTKLAGDCGSIVGKDGPGNHFVPGSGEYEGGQIAAHVLTIASGAFIGTGEDSDTNHGYKHTGEQRTK